MSNMQAVPEIESLIECVHAGLIKLKARVADLPPSLRGNTTRMLEIDLVSLAKVIYTARRARDRILPNDIIGEPAYDILLDAFIAREENRLITVSSACIAASVPPTTGLRWVRLLEEHRLLERSATNHDRRLRYVRLSDLGRTMMINSLMAEREVFRREIK